MGCCHDNVPTVITRDNCEGYPTDFDSCPRGKAQGDFGLANPRAGRREGLWIGVKVDAATGNECMTIDLAGCSAEKLANLAAVLSGEPLEATVAACSLLTLDGGADEGETVNVRGRR